MNTSRKALNCALSMVISPPSSLTFSDQFAFCPIGSTEAAIITLLYTVTDLLRSNPYVVVIALDFSKAFDTVRHSTLLQKAAELDLPDHVYNWLVHFFEGHSHRTVYTGDTSSTKTITASIIQGSSIGPAAYLITSSDLKTLHLGNRIVKFADDTYLIIPASGFNTRSAEMDNIRDWAARNNLTLNMIKTTETVIYDCRKTQQDTPPPLPSITRDDTLRILGVTLTRRLSASDHIRRVVSECSQTLYALRVRVTTA